MAWFARLTGNRKRTVAPVKRTRLRLETLEDRITPSVSVVLDYSLDTAGFFNDAARRAVLQTAVNAISSQLNDSLTAIIPTGSNTWAPQIFDPATGNSRVLAQMNINQDEIRIYVGGRNLAGSEAGEGASGGAFQISGSNSWIDTVLNRGQGNTQGSNAVDFAPWGGSIAFDTNTNWYFGTDSSGIRSNQLSFYSVAQHEFGHVLGFGTADSYFDKLSGSSFTGSNAVTSFGSAVPLSGDLDHWAQSVTSGGRQASMTPVLVQGTFTSFTSLDFAGLADIGWQVTGGGGVPYVPPTFGGVRGQHIYAVGTEPGNAPHVEVFNLDGTLRFSFFAYAPNVTTGIRVATGDVTGDGYDDIITGAGPGGGPHVKVFDGRTGLEIRSFFAYAPSFSAGVFVAAGDVNGDGRADIITGAGPGGGPHVQVFDAVTGQSIRSFFAYAPDYSGGVNVASGDLNHDGRADIITGTGPNSAAHVRAFDGQTLNLLYSFFAYTPLFTGGVTVASGDVNGDGFDDIICAAGPGGGPHVEAFSGRNGTQLSSFFASTANVVNGINVTVADVNGDGKADYITGLGKGAPPIITIFSGANQSVLDQFYPYEQAYTGGFYLG